MAKIREAIAQRKRWRKVSTTNGKQTMGLSQIGIGR